MRVVVYTDNIKSNIRKAERLVNKPISLIFKDYYEDVYSHIGESERKIFGRNEGICFSIGKATEKNAGAMVTTVLEGIRCIKGLGLKELYIPINAYDNREGLSVYDTDILARTLKSIDKETNVYGMITCGCLNCNHPELSEMNEMWEKLQSSIEAISLGGSFWLDKGELPSYISDVRIGEYMLLGTIPYSSDTEKRGENGIEIEAKIVGVYPERGQLLIDCGYSVADVKDCRTLDTALQYQYSSSEYTIYAAPDVSSYRLGETVRLISNYYSLVKMRNAAYEYR